MIARRLRFSIDNYDDFKNWNFAVDQDAIYIAAQNRSSQDIYLWRLSWEDYEDANIWDFWRTGLVCTYTVADSRDWLQSIDADEGYVVMDLFCWGEATLVLYDHSTRSVTAINPDLEGSYVQILKIP
jgi:hypothetical protein